MSLRLRWPTQYGTINQKFGARPEYYQKFGLPAHEGIDFMAPEGSEIYAATDGFVSQISLDGNTKPYGNQVRVQHADGYETIYAHLSEAVVARGQFVQAGQLIGLAGNTGNSSGAHLHFGLKHKGATQRKETHYPYDLIDPTPYLEPFSGDKPVKPTPPETASLEVQVESPEAGYLNVRDAPHVGGELVGRVSHGDKLGALEDAEIARNKVGKNGQWLWVRTPDKKVGYIAAWYVKLPASTPPVTTKVTFVVVESPDEPLRLRQGPGVEHAQVAQMTHGTVLKALEPEDDVKKKIGQFNQWLQVQTPNGISGYTAAWYLTFKSRPEPVIPTPVTGKPIQYVQVESPEFGLKVRGGPGTNHKEVWWVPHATMLESQENKATTGNKVGQQDQWIKVRTPAQKEGYVAAWYTRAPQSDDNRKAAEGDRLPTCISPHIFGIHAVTLGDDPRTKDKIRSLYHGKHKKGWIFFTEAVGQDPNGVHLNGEVRKWLWEWADQGYGVIVRLNNDYEPSGTLPESRYYDGFAAACARWVELYLKRPELNQDEYTWTIQIANEQNNPREHPGGWDHPREHITAELYAQAFNKTYTRIKEVLPNTIVCPGAIDPYNAAPLKLAGNTRWRPLDYYQTMLENIKSLDGVILHAYTHGPSLDAVTSLQTFGDPFLGDHYFDFQTYRLFMERIPGKWKDVPVYITETNHICRPPSAPVCSDPNALGWIDANTGWVREIYKEINRWNEMPYAQQIRALLLYRWTGDQWTIENKKGILDDFKQALDNDYRWRTTPPATAGAFAFALPAAEEVIYPEEEEERALVKPDNLKRLWGIGTKTEKALNAAGILIFEDIEKLTPEELTQILSETGIRKNFLRYVDSWPTQARLATEEKWAELKAYVNQEKAK